MLEKTVEKELCDRVKNDLGGWALKFVSPGQNGVPDRIVLVPYGRIYFVETKAPGKKLRRLQKYVCGLIKQLGFKVLRIDTKEKVEAFVREVKKGWEKYNDPKNLMVFSSQKEHAAFYAKGGDRNGI